MSTNSGFRLSDGLLNSLLALLFWLSLSAGVHSLVTGASALGVLEVGLAVIILALWAGGVLHKRAAGRRSPGVALMLGFLAFVMILYGIFRLSDLTRTSIFAFGEVQIPETIRAVSAAGFYILLVVFLYQLFIAFRERGVETPSQGND